MAEDGDRERDQDEESDDDDEGFHGGLVISVWNAKGAKGGPDAGAYDPRATLPRGAGTPHPGPLARQC